MSTVTVNLVSKAGADQASLSAVSWAWFDQDIGALSAPTDKGSTETTDANGEMVITLTVSVLTSGQIGTLVLYDSTGGKLGAYRVAVD